MTGSSILSVAPVLKQLHFPECFRINDEENKVISPQEGFTYQGGDLDHIKNYRGLKIDHLNTNGLLSKLVYIKIMIKEYFFDIFSISESELDTNIFDGEIKMHGYVSYHQGHKRQGVGVLFYVNVQLESHILKYLTD